MVTVHLLALRLDDNMFSASRMNLFCGRYCCPSLSRGTALRSQCRTLSAPRQGLVTDLSRPGQIVVTQQHAFRFRRLDPYLARTRDSASVLSEGDNQALGE